MDDGRPVLPKEVSCVRWPLADSRHTVNAFFRDARHPIVPNKHDGIDLRATAGSDILAPVAGVVTKAREPGTCIDASVKVEFGPGWSYEVHHLSRVDVKVGETIVLGRRLGLSGGAVGAPGSGPWTTGAHLHFMLVHEGARVNPLTYFCP